MLQLDILPPPEGLDLAEIASDDGLLRAIEREAEKIREAEKPGNRLSRDQIRLITYLANEVRRRIANLTSEQRWELEEIRERSQDRQMENKVAEVITAVEEFELSLNNPKSVVRFARISELESEVDMMVRALGRRPERWGELVDVMRQTMGRLTKIKSRNTVMAGFQLFD